ncbi:MAG TPA: R3H domain-containing nucleic acid-binding protein [Anaerolineales bacterium]|nr:R3H domain-containing nucleic acid-binding protein [Anaerolineales bacterium]
MKKRITDDLHDLLMILPPTIGQALTAANRTEDLLEVILDLGRVPTARYVDGEVRLTDTEIAHDDINYAVARVGDFDADNRAGIERTLHRISAIRNRRGHIVGLTCRVGRAVYGTTEIVKDLIESGKSILLLGKPGIGKTTMLREAARILADKKRVVIVDTSNEIGGDGDVPHPAVGKARRMQVAQPSLQHEVMIEAVENHNPEVIVIDEIGRELEAAAARTIAERGVQLIGTAHGQTLDNLLLNPTLADLVGGIESVTLSDEEARRRGTQKTVLERRAPPTFDVLIEIQDRHMLVVHPDMAAAVDGILRGRPMPTERRYEDEQGQIHKDTVAPPAPARGRGTNGRGIDLRLQAVTAFPVVERHPVTQADRATESPNDRTSSISPLNIYAYGITRQRLEQAARRMRLPLHVVDDLALAQALVTLKTYYRRHQRPISDAEERGLPVYVLRSNSSTQMENFLADLFNMQAEPTEDDTDAVEQAMRETQSAIQTVFSGSRTVDLSPQSATVRRLQHELARQANLISHSYGKEPYRRVRIFRE